MSIDLLERLVELESDVAYQQPPSADEPEFKYIDGKLPVLFSAPHGAAHFRDGDVKEEDEFTAGLACLVAELSGAQALYVRRYSEQDASYYPGVPYKQKIAALAAAGKIHFLVDLHGASPKRKFGIAIGTLNGLSCPDQLDTIKNNLASQGFTSRTGAALHDFIDVDRCFTAIGTDHQETVTAYAYRKLGIPAAQLEINAHLRIVRHLPGCMHAGPFQGDPERIRRVIHALEAIAKALATT